MSPANKRKNRKAGQASATAPTRTQEGSATPSNSGGGTRFELSKAQRRALEALVTLSLSTLSPLEDVWDDAFLQMCKIVNKTEPITVNEEVASFWAHDTTSLEPEMPSSGELTIGDEEEILSIPESGSAAPDWARLTQHLRDTETQDSCPITTEILRARKIISRGGRATDRHEMTRTALSLTKAAKSQQDPGIKSALLTMADSVKEQDVERRSSDILINTTLEGDFKRHAYDVVKPIFDKARGEGNNPTFGFVETLAQMLDDHPGVYDDFAREVDLRWHHSSPDGITNLSTGETVYRRTDSGSS